MYIEKRAKIKDLLTSLKEDFQAGGWTEVDYRANFEEPGYPGVQKEFLVVQTTTQPQDPEKEGITRSLVIDRILGNDLGKHGLNIRGTTSWNKTLSRFDTGALTTHNMRVDWLPFRNHVPAGLTQGTGASPTGINHPWFIQNYSVQPVSINGFNEDTYIRYYMNINENRVIIAFESDASIGLSYDRRITWLYAGAIVPFSSDDIEGNFAITCGSNFQDIATMGEYDLNRYNNNERIAYKNYRENGFTPDLSFGDFTASGQDDILMWGTSSGYPFQKHYASIVTHKDGLPTSRFNSSNWTDQYYLTPIYVVHGEDGFRGYLDGVMGIHKHSIVHRDELSVEEDGVTGGEPKKYKFIDVSAEKTIFKNLANQNIGLVISMDEAAD